MADVVEAYLKDLSEIYRTGGGVAEESYYGALERLLNELGRGLKPRVRCVPQLKNIGGGEPDFGLYTASQFQRAKDTRPLHGQLPQRGVIECKGWEDDSFVTAHGAQVSKYWERYGLVLVTNYRDFVLVGRDNEGKAVRLESLRLAESEAEFREMLALPRKAAQTHGVRLTEFLRRTMLHAADVTSPEDLAWFLASFAREARARVEAAAELPALEGLKQAMEEALGMKFEGDKGEHFFLATLVQTLFYGIFSSWVLWCREHWGRKEARFNWHDAAWTLHVPMIASLFDQIATPKRLKPLGVDEVLDWAGMVLNRVDRAAFFSRFDEGHAVQYFYEPFLNAYDPELRRELGVWYTPPEIVKYQVERVDRVLREELGIADGLADEQVVVLDPCCGTGAYLVETLKRIHTTLMAKGPSALTAQRLKKAAMERVFGFEILPAPFVVSHLQIGFMLRTLGAPLDPQTNERAGVFLTNALTGWEPLEDPKALLPFPELKEERDKANQVKQEAPILVVLGNPPYNAFAGTSPQEEGGLVECYKGAYREAVHSRKGKTKHVTRYRLSDPVDKGGWGIKKYNLDDLYVRFFRIAERRIVKSGRGIVSYISNYSYLGEPSFAIMRQEFLDEFDRVWIDCMNGDSRETGKLTPDGHPDPSVFSTEQRAIGIRVGTAICMLVRKAERERTPIVRFRNYWGVNKRSDLLESLAVTNLNKRYERARPGKANRYSFRPLKVKGTYLGWPRVVDLSEVAPTNGLMEKRGGALIDIDRETLASRMRMYFDKRLDWDSLVARGCGLCQNAARYKAKACRKKVLAAEDFDEGRICRYAVRPFDLRWCYYSAVRPLWNEPRPRYLTHCWKGNSFFMTRFRSTAVPEGVPCYFVRGLSDDHFMTPDNACFPIRLDGDTDEPEADAAAGKMFGDDGHGKGVRANLSESARGYLAALGIRDPDGDEERAGLIWMHALAICHSGVYLEENADGVRQDWPRIPLPKTKKALLKSAALGRRVAALLDTEKAVDGVTAGRMDKRLVKIGVMSRVEGGSIDPNKGELDVTAGWGHPGKGGVVMPGRGQMEVREQRDAALRKVFGDETLDVYLNEQAYWANVPRAVWDYYIGGYQVVKKWLSYREKALLGRGLRVEEAEYVTQMLRRIAALVLMREELDANYGAVKGDVWAWGT